MKAGQRVKADFLKDNWYAVFKVKETVRDESRALGYVYAPLLKLDPPETTNRKTAKALKVKLPAMSPKRLGLIMEEAKKALTDGKYRRAIQLYTKVLNYPRHQYRQKAQELLGLARERNGQRSHARAEYREYLRLYPQGKGADRVNQRLAGLETARAKPRKKLKRAKRERKKMEIYGSFSQFGNRNDSYTDLGGLTHNTSSLNSNLDLTVRYRSDNYEFGSVIIGGFERDFLDVSDNVSRLSRSYFKCLHKRKQVSIKIGRQQSSSSGVLGRFDGVVFSFPLNSKVKTNIISGFPVNTPKIDTYEKNRYFYGLNFDFGTFADNWDFNAFVINQMVNDLSDRQAAGGEVRYFHLKRSFFSFMDYDFSYKELNTFLLMGNLTLPTETILNLSYDYRKSPPLSTSNATIGQGPDTDSPVDMLKTMSEKEVRKLATDRTAISKSFLLGLTHQLNDKLQLSGDLTISRLSSTHSSGGVEGVEGTGYEYFYNTQLIGSNLITAGDITTLGLRYSDASTTDTYSVLLNTRYPYTRNFRVNPRLRLDFRKNKRKKEERVKFKPVLRLDYRWRKLVWLELETGAEWDENRIDQLDSTTSYFLSLGYRVDF